MKERSMKSGLLPKEPALIWRRSSIPGNHHFISCHHLPQDFEFTDRKREWKSSKMAQSIFPCHHARPYCHFFQIHADALSWPATSFSVPIVCRTPLSPLRCHQTPWLSVLPTKRSLEVESLSSLVSASHCRSWVLHSPEASMGNFQLILVEWTNG